MTLRAQRPRNTIRHSKRPLSISRKTLYFLQGQWRVPWLSCLTHGLEIHVYFSFQQRKALESYMLYVYIYIALAHSSATMLILFNFEGSVQDSVLWRSSVCWRGMSAYSALSVRWEQLWVSDELLWWFMVSDGSFWNVLNGAACNFVL